MITKAQMPLEEENPGLSPSLAMEETETEQHTATAAALATTLHP